MPVYTVHWANRSRIDQDWIVSNGDNFLLTPKHVRLINIYPNDDRNYIIAVSASDAYVSANLSYSADLQAWSLNSHTPNEWQLITSHGNVTVNCFLKNNDTPPRSTEHPDLIADTDTDNWRSRTHPMNKPH